MPESPLHAPLLCWYDAHARDLPWRQPEAGAWAVLVSEVMLQQTPVARVLPVYGAWLHRWPTPAALAAEPSGEAVRMWGRLGYPRRALRLHAAAVVIDRDHDGRVPDDYDTLRGLPGIGDYTAAAVAAFAYRRRHVVLDTNVRRVLARVAGGVALPGKHVIASERGRAAGLLPDRPESAARWNVAVMELGALVCTAASPQCSDCPVAASCRWRAAGYPAYDGPPRRAQTYAGTDRQCRGRILALVRESEQSVDRGSIDGLWDDPVQRERALDSLIDDGLVVIGAEGTLRLP